MIFDLHVVDDLQVTMPGAAYWFTRGGSPGPGGSWPVVATPNRKRITQLFVKRRRRNNVLLVYTPGRVYYLRRKKLRLWRRT